MTYEKEIPDYAMLPAKEMEETLIIPVTKGAVYAPMQVTNITEKPKTTITVEEDILVPDTKPDLAEILMADGKATLSSREINQINKADDYINLSGDIELEMLYLPEKPESCGEIISVQTRIPFKDQWHTSLAQGACMVMECEIEKIEYMVINERKYRVKVSLAIYAKEYADNKIELFEGITDEEIQTLKEKIEISNVALRKKDTLAIHENIPIKDECRIENILKQDICVIENYKQVTGEKVVINGFISVNLLYAAGCEDENSDPCALRQVSDKVEFTQFIPISQINDESGSCVSFDSSDLKVKLVQDEEDGEVLRLEGDLVTYIEIYRNVQREIIVDGYHREKDFICDFKEEHSRAMVGTTAGESSVREIISPENTDGDIEKIIYTKAEISECKSTPEQGKIMTEGTIRVKMICRTHVPEPSSTGRVFSLKENIPFRIVTAMPQITGGEIICDRVCIKDFWAEKINGKQIEFNATVVINTQVMRDVPFKIPINPAFEEKPMREEKSRMVIYITGENDSMWSIAKKFKTTMAAIQEINELDNELIAQGQKLLILK